MSDTEQMPEQMMYQPFFDLVADKDNWKRPIDKTINAPFGAEDCALFCHMIKRAIAFYAGGEASALECGERLNSHGQVIGKVIRVTAPGYYALIGS